jgi:hypothetical protein
MDKKHTDALDELFARAATKKEAEERQRDLEAEARAEFLTSFLEVREAVIIPAFTEFAEAVSARGWEAIVTTTDDKADKRDARGATVSAGTQAGAGIEFRQSNRETAYREQYPRFQLRCNKAARSVIFHSSTIGPGHGGSSTSAGEAKLGELTPEYLHDKLVKYFAELMRNAGAIR